MSPGVNALTLRWQFILTGALLLVGQSEAIARTIVAEVVALEQVQVYNRFGAYNPVGMQYALRRDVVDKSSGLSEAEGATLRPGGVMLRPGKRPRPLVLRGNAGDTLVVHFTNLLSPQREHSDAPFTRLASMAAVGLTPVGNNKDPLNTGIAGIAPGQSQTYGWSLEREGTHLIFSNGAPAGGQGDGGSLVLGLFGAINVEPAGTVWYRSQVTADELAAATARDEGGAPAHLPTGHPRLDYGAEDANGIPILAMLKSQGGNTHELVHADLDALITGSGDGFREFTIIFHDELKTVQAFPVLDAEQLHGVRDGFGVNYGASGMGAILMANRLGEGPAKECVECFYEEFFLTSWANGDPALLVQYEDDPSNVHHSYLNDRVKIRNLHAGPKETHIFHLHAHQWVGNPSSDNSNYLDSQTIAPAQGFTYDIYYGGSGNRNRTPGDAIFHCHLYPHFASGMWGLWRVHDVFEDGTRRLADGEYGPGTDPLTGVTDGGTPIPAVVPLPSLALAPLPTYASVDSNGDGALDGMPGYPFYIAGEAGHRPPQAPYDLARDGGLPRHVVLAGARNARQDLAAADFSAELLAADLRILPQEGTPLEQAAMAFHATPGGFASITQEGSAASFAVNGLPPQPGAPFADPCPPGQATGERVYNVSAIQLDLLVNAAGWHNPQARINVLDSDVPRYEGRSTTADPFFFRANSGECVVFRHTNRTPNVLEKDDFQVRTPTDTIGQHIHLVKFDVTASDGSGNGWNYEDGTFSAQAIAERIEASHAGSAVDLSGEPVNLSMEDSGFQTTVQRWWADPLLNGQGQDRTIRTVFTHDHFAPSSIQHYGFYNALVIEPAGSSWLTQDGKDDLSQPLNPARGVGTQAIILGADDLDTHPPTREFMVAVADFGVLYDPTADAGTSCPEAVRPELGCPVNPPEAPEAISADDPGAFLVNYKNEPIPLRVGQFDASGSFVGLKSGDAGDMAYVFSSAVHGDPFTEIYRAYEGDRIRFALIQGAQEEQHVFAISGMRWQREPSGPGARFLNAQAIGISEHFEMECPALPESAPNTAVTDFLYRDANTDGLWSGVWGLIRVYKDRATAQADLADGSAGMTDLAELPGNPGRIRRTELSQGFRSDGCPLDAPLRSFTLEAWAARDLLPGGELVYNARAGITDPSGLLYIHARDRFLLQSGAKEPEPLVIRANAGDCIRIRLTNRLPQNVPDHLGDAKLLPIASMQADDFRPSNKVGLHPALVSYDARNSDGANIGRNAIQTAAPGRTVTYTWYAGEIEVEPDPTYAGDDKRKKVATPLEYGAINLAPFGDVIKQGAQGLAGMLIIEPQGASYAAPSGSPTNDGTVAVISYPDPQTGLYRSFREFVVFKQGGLNLLERGIAMPSNHVVDDSDDDGEVAINYRTEPFCTRFGLPADCDTHDVAYPADFFLGPIETPVFSALGGEEIRFRVGYPHGPTRQEAFIVYGHDYPDLGSAGYGSGASLSAPGLAFDAIPYGGAKPGTWIYRASPSHRFASGSWGRLEVQ